MFCKQHINQKYFIFSVDDQPVEKKKKNSTSLTLRYFTFYLKTHSGGGYCSLNLNWSNW